MTLQRIIAGPCQHQSLEHSRIIIEHCGRICSRWRFEYVFKASFDKANRTSANSQRGPGLESTLADFAQLRQDYPMMPILTDVHQPWQVEWIETNYPGVITVYQIPAFLSRQTDLIQAACETGRTVNIKKGQFMAPWDVAGILSKTGDHDVWITERGTSFGYNTLVVDFTGIDYMLRNYSVPIVLDATHAVQKPGGQGTTSGGNREYVPGLTRAAAALGVKHFFMEVHDDPDNAPSDGANALHLDDFETVVENIRHHSVKHDGDA